MAPDRRGPSDGGHGYLVEFVQMGNTTKVSAIDPATGIEVSIVGPTNAGQAILTRNVVAKLNRRLAQRDPGRGQG